MASLYFAYGSNMSRARLRARGLEGRALGPARLAGWRFACNKQGRDGTAKANLVADSGAHAWGVLWELPQDGLARLDPFESGYARVSVEVETVDGRRSRASTYVSDRLAADPTPSDAYRRCVLEGAREHDLPAEWLDRLEALLGGVPGGGIRRARSEA